MPPVASVPGGRKNRNGHRMTCLPFEGRVQERYERRHDSVLCFETLFGASCWVDSMFVWFPAAWMPLVVEAIRAKNVWWERARGHQGAVASTDHHNTPLPEAREFRFKYKKWQMDEEGQSPILDARVNVDWLTLDTRTFSHFFRQLYSGILHDVFTQKASIWAGTLLQLVEWWSVSFFRAAWKWSIGCCWPDRKGTCGPCK